MNQHRGRCCYCYSALYCLSVYNEITSTTGSLCFTEKRFIKKNNRIAASDIIFKIQINPQALAADPCRGPIVRDKIILFWPLIGRCVICFSKNVFLALLNCPLLSSWNQANVLGLPLPHARTCLAAVYIHTGALPRRSINIKLPSLNY